MAQGALIRAGAASAVLLAGAAVELAAADAAPALRVTDFAVGATFAGLAAWVWPRERGAGLIGGAAAITWFLGTAAASFALVHRGPVVHLLVRAPRDRAPRPIERALAAAAWIAALVPVVVAGPATACVAGLSGVTLALRAHRARAGRWPVNLGASACLLLLAGLWAAAAAGVGGTALLLADEAALVASAVVGMTGAFGVWGQPATDPLIVELSTGDPGTSPVTAQIARALADPDLEIRYQLPGGGWVDERGREVESPDDDPRLVTRAAAPDGGSVAVIHSSGASVEHKLAGAAAAAAALALDSARLDAEVRAHAADVRVARRRLLTTADRERRALAEQLEEGPLPRLRRVRRLLENRDDTLAAELDGASAELVALGRGLYPPCVALRQLPEALADMTSRSPVPTRLGRVDQLRTLSDEVQAAIWFLCSEALTNIARHSCATSASVNIGIDSGRVVVEIDDDGRGGATFARGLRGLKDRIEALGGTLDLDSPAGGPTSLRALLPLEP